MGTNRTAKVLVTNNFNNPANITLKHRYSNNSDETKTWKNVAFGKDGSDPLEVHFRTGFGTGFDYWHVIVEVLAGPQKGTWENNGMKECFLKASDEGTTHHFSVSEAGGFKINIVSNGCQADLSKS